MRSHTCGYVPAERRASSGPIGKPWQRITPGERYSRPTGTTRWLASVFPPLRNRVVHLAGHRVTLWRTVAVTCRPCS